MEWMLVGFLFRHKGNYFFINFCIKLHVENKISDLWLHSQIINTFTNLTNNNNQIYTLKSYLATLDFILSLNGKVIFQKRFFKFMKVSLY